MGGGARARWRRWLNWWALAFATLTAGCVGEAVAALDLAVHDLGAPVPEIAAASSGGPSPGVKDRCAAAECNAPLDRRETYTNPAKGER